MVSTALKKRHPKLDKPFDMLFHLRFVFLARVSVTKILALKQMHDAVHVGRIYGAQCCALRALASGRRDDRPVTRDLPELGQTACEYLTALDGTGYDVCVRSDAPFDLRAPRGARLVVPHQNRWACVGGAYFEVSIASGATRVPGVTPCVAVGVCQRAFKRRAVRKSQFCDLLAATSARRRG